MSKSRICKAFNNTRVILLALFVALLFASCSPSSLTLCRVGIDNDKDSRTLSAVIDPLGSNIYYRTIYKGSGDYYSSNFSTSYNRLTGEGIIVSQGLWEVQVVFSNEEKTSYTESEATSLIHATSGDIFINLNTTSITVEIESGYGYAEITSYQLTGNVPSSPSVEVKLFKYNGSTFDSITDTVYSGFINGTLDTNNVFTNTKTSLPAGIYYVVLTVNSSSSVKFVDTIAFVVRKGLTTNISGSCTSYNSEATHNNVIVDPNGTVDTNTDIKNFGTEDFGKDVTYVIDGGNNNDVYQMIPTENQTYNKELTDHKVTIDMNGNSIVNSTNTQNKTYFTIDKEASLSLINSQEGLNNIGAANYGEKNKASKDTNFIVNGGTLNIGSNDSSISPGNIMVNGVTAIQEAGGNPARAAIEFSTYGGKINLSAPDNKYTIISNTVRGISNILPRESETNRNLDSVMNLDITLENATIEATGDSNAKETGISIDGTRTLNSTTDFYYGTININIKGKGDGYSILTTNTNKSSMEQSAIFISNYKGDIIIDLDSAARIVSQNGCGIYLKNCSGNITITNYGSITGKNGAITYDNCPYVTVNNHGTLTSLTSNYSMVNYSNSNAPKTNEGLSLFIVG